jgi:hypothetical protein
MVALPGSSLGYGDLFNKLKPGELLSGEASKWGEENH